MAYSSGLAPSAVKTAIDEAFFVEFDYGKNMADLATAETEGVFRSVDAAGRMAYVTEQLQGAGYFSQRSELQDVAQATPRLGNQDTTNLLIFANSIDISKTLFDNDLHDTVGKLVTDFGRLARMSRDRNAFKVFRNAFGTQDTNDGADFFSNGHTTLNGTTVDNLETGSLTEASLETAINSLRTQKTQDGSLGGHEPAVLLVPTALHKEAMIITKSELRSGTGNNDLNWYSNTWPGLMVKWSPFLDSAEGGSDTAWFLLSRNHSVSRFVNKGVETAMVSWETQRNNAYIYKAEFIEEVDVTSYDGAVGSTGAV